MTMRPSPVCLFLSFVVCSLELSSPARSQPLDRVAAAEALFEQGRTLVEAGELADACPRFLASQQLDPGVGTLLWLADCYAGIGRTESAWVAFGEAAAAATRNQDRRAAVAIAKRDELEKKLSASAVRRLSVTVPVLETVPEAQAEAPATAHDAIPDVQAPRERPQGLGGQRWIGIASMGLGATGLIVGTVWSLQAKSTYDQSTTGPCSANNACTQAGLDERSGARTMATEATVAIGIGAVAMATGAVLFFTAPRSVTAGSVAVAPVVWASGASVTMSGAF
jgi:hypothetical protein